MKKIKKEITFFYTDNVEKQTVLPISLEAEKRGYQVKFTDNIFEKAEIGFYCQHLNFPKNSKFSCVHLHDLGQQHGQWPIMWKNEFWSQFGLGFLPSKEWADMWHNASCYDFVRPRYGCYHVGWAKADFIFDKTHDNSEKIINEYKIDTKRKSILYAPSWEWDGRQLEIIEAVKDLTVNLLIKQAPWNPTLYPEQYNIIQDMYKKSKGKENVYLIDPNVSIFDVIKISDALISEESSTLYEAMLLEKPVIAVTDWLIPDTTPPRLPEFPYDFAIHIEKSKINETIFKVLSDSEYKTRITDYRKENFPNIGNAAKTVMDVLDNVLYGANNEVPRIEELPLVPTPREYKQTVAKRKAIMRRIFIKKNIVDKNKVLLFIWNLLRMLKHSLKNSGGYNSIVYLQGNYCAPSLCEAA